MGYCIGMMKKYRTILQLFSAAGLFCLCGCGPSAPEGASPTERNALVIRMFRSMEKGDTVSAAAQAAKVRALDPGNAYFSWIIEVQECNQLIAQAQKSLDAGDFADAEAQLQEARNRYPLQPLVTAELKKVRQLRQLQAAVRTYCAAKDVAGRERALKVLTRQAELVRDPLLNARCAVLRKELDQEIARELAARKAAAAKTAEPVRKP